MPGGRKGGREIPGNGGIPVGGPDIGNILAIFDTTCEGGNGGLAGIGGADDICGCDCGIVVFGPILSFEGSERNLTF